MKKLSSVLSPCRLTSLIVLIATIIFLCLTPALVAQCADDDDPDSLACQIELPANPTSPTVESPAVLSISEGAPGTPRADRSNEASAKGSLSGGSSFTESATSAGRPLGASPRSFEKDSEPPTEFQRFVAATTGQMLSIYGTGLFADQASFGPIDHAPAPADLVVGAGDELRIRVWGQVNFSANLRVSREGEIYLPKAGTVHIAGLPVAAVQDHLRQALDRVYRNFELSVDLGEIHSIQIYVTGAARRPGEYTVSALSTLIDALFSSGGPSGVGSMRDIKLIRAGHAIARLDLYALLLKGDKTDVQLQPGDVIFISDVGAQVAILGSVRRQGIYELRQNETFANALEAAGGKTSTAMDTSISVERIEDHTSRRAFELRADAEGLRSLLADGDIVRVAPIVSYYRDTVTLRGALANPGRFRWHTGMRLSELMPDRDSLVTRGYWWRRTQQGLSAPEFVGKFSTGSELDPGASKQAAALTPGAQTNWDFAVIERLDRATMTTSLLSFDLGKLVLDHDLSQDRELMAGDVITVFSQEDVRPPADRRTKYIALDGEVVKAGIYSVVPGETLRSVVLRAGGLTSKAYLYGAEFTRESTRALQQQRLNEYTERWAHQMERNSLALSDAEPAGNQPVPQKSTALSANQELIARLRQVHASGRIVLNIGPASNSAADLPDIALEDGDRLMVPATPSTIQVIGSVFNQNAFLYHRGARTGEYLRMSGGPTREADRGQLYVLRADGSVVSRDARQSIFAATEFDSLRLNPGDTVVVPEKMVRPSSMRQLMNWSQIVSQLSLGAASIDLLK